VSVVLTRLPKRFLPAALVYTLCLALIGGLIAFVSNEMSGAAGARAAIFALLLCWVAGITALGTVAIFAKTPKYLAGLLASILCRTGIPLVGLLLLKQMPELDAAGGGMILMTTYLFSLVLDVVLTVGLIYEPLTAAQAGRSTAQPLSNASREVI
jgi:hypothetical protein